MASPLDLLLADGVIDEVLGRLKSGKEADISLVTHRGQVVAAKVYKDRATRSFKNNADYKEGRKTRNSRTQRAIEGGGRFGRDAAEEAWKTAESNALHRLAAHGVRVPRPVMFYEGVLLMELVTGDDGRPAPRLIDIALEPAAATAIFLDLRRQIIAMLCCDLIHGDLSPYNILAGAGGPTIIDFPQVISAAHSSRAEFFFQRDFTNVLRHLAAIAPALAPHAADAHAIWRAYVGRFLTPDFIPPPPRPPPPPRRPPPPRPAPAPRPPPRHDLRHPDVRSARPDPRSSHPDDRSFRPGDRTPRPDDRRPAPRTDQPPGRPDDRSLRPSDRPARPDDRRPASRSDQDPPRTDDRSPRPDARPSRPDDRRPPPRSDQHPARPGARVDPRAAPRTDPHPARRPDPRPDPRTTPRADPRPRVDPRPAPRGSHPSASHDDRPSSPGRPGRRRPRRR